MCSDEREPQNDPLTAPCRPEKISDYAASQDDTTSLLTPSTLDDSRTGDSVEVTSHVGEVPLDSLEDITHPLLSGGNLSDSTQADCAPNDASSPALSSTTPTAPLPAPVSPHPSWRKKTGNWVRGLMPDLEEWNGEETPKEVCSNSKKSALEHCALYHLPSVSITLGLLGLYLVNNKPLNLTAEELSALQYAAKAHESFILISITDILMHRTCFELIAGEGIPFGFITSAFYLGSPINYLKSWEFWAAISNPTKNLISHVTTSILIILLIFLAFGAGPFSATVMIPRLGWWELPDYFPGTLSENPYALDLSSKNVFRCDDDERYLSCGDNDLEQTLETFQAIIDSPPLFPQVGNLTYNTTASANKRPMTVSVAGGLGTSLAVATCPMRFLIDTFDWTFENLRLLKIEKGTDVLVQSKPQDLPKMKEWRQPLVAVECTPRLFDGTDPITFEFEDKLYTKHVVSLPSDTIDQLKELTKNTTLSGPLDPLFPDLENDRSLPISGAILLPDIISYNGTELQTRILNLCLIHARWIDSTVWQVMQKQEVDIHSEDLRSPIQSALGFPIEDTFTYIQKHSTTADVIRIRENYLRGIGANYEPIPSRVNLVYQEAMRSCTGSSNCLSISLAIFLTDALAQSTNIRGFNSSAGNSIDKFALFKATFSQYGYAYRFQYSTTIALAFSGLLLHYCILIVHVCIIIFSKQLWSVSWGTVGQMLGLALRSKVTEEELRNVGGGVASSQTWKKTVVIREVGGGGQLQMILDLETASEQTFNNHQVTPCQINYVKAGLKYK